MTWEDVLFKDSLVIGGPATGIVISSLRPLLALSKENFEALLPPRETPNCKAVYDSLTKLQSAVEGATLLGLFPEYPPVMTNENPLGAADTLVVVWTDTPLSTIPDPFCTVVSPLSTRHSADPTALQAPSFVSPM